jgi:hypothetical protein
MQANDRSTAECKHCEESGHGTMTAVKWKTAASWNESDSTSVCYNHAKLSDVYQPHVIVVARALSMQLLLL